LNGVVVHSGLSADGRPSCASRSLVGNVL